MRPLLTREESRAFDAHAMATIGVPGVLLMENAGAGAARALCERLAAELRAVVVVGGVGQNGGDAWVVARHLLSRGIVPACFLIGDSERVRGDALINLRMLTALGVHVERVSEADPLREALRGASVVVDGLFGTGLDRPIDGLYAECVDAINGSLVPVFALDLPSGIDASSGQPLGPCIRAQLTATFAAEKRGLCQFPGRDLAGEIVVVGLGVPSPLLGNCGVIEATDVAERMPSRAREGHKGSHGHVALFAGSAGKTGAAVLASLGALHGGAGLVTLATDSATQQALDLKVIEAMTFALDARDPLQSALSFAAGKHACLVGPGFGTHPERLALMRALARDLPVPVVLDADALTALAEAPGELHSAAAPRVLTPHPGEAARLLGVPSGEVNRDRFAAASALASLTGQVVALKGAGTVIAAPDGRLAVCERGTPALGAGGTGDVLAGLTTALLATLPPFDAALCAVELHARAGELAALSDRGLLARDVAAALPRALEACRAG